jgi:hypothetical protein
MKTAALARSLFVLFAVILKPAATILGQPIFVEYSIVQRPSPPVSEPTGQVAELIGRLSDESPSTRQSAARRLLEMGPAIEPQLRGALRYEAPQTNFPFIYPAKAPGPVELIPAALLPRYKLNELDELISRLDEQRNLNGSVITLHHKHAPVEEVLRDLSLQADAAVGVGSWYNLLGSDWRKTNRTSVDVDGANYWDALGALRNSAGIATVTMNGPNRLIFGGLPPVQQPSVQQPAGHTARPPSAVVSGPFEVTPVSAELNRRMEYGVKATSAVVKLTMEAQAEPKLGDLGLRAVVRVKRCLDDRGKSLVLDGTNTFRSAQSSLGGRWSLTAEVAEPRPGRRIKSFEGELSVAVGPAQRYLAITDLMLARTQSREFDGMIITVERVAQSNQAYEAQLSLSAPKGSPYAVNFTEGDEPNIGLWDEARHDLSRREHLYIGFEGLSQANGRDVWRWRLASNHPPSALTWLTPQQTRWITVPFELHDLPVP